VHSHTQYARRLPFAISLQWRTLIAVLPAALLAAAAGESAASRPSGSAPPTTLIQRASRGTIAAQPAAASVTLQFSNGYRFDPLREGEPALAPSLRAGQTAAGRTGSFLVQLRGPIQTDQRAGIEAAGAAIFWYLPDHAYLVRMPAEARAAVAALPYVRWVGDYHPAYKLSGALELTTAEATQTVVVLLFPDADMAAARAAVQSLGGAVLSASDAGPNKILRVSLSTSQIQRLATRDEVAWIEPWVQPTLSNNLVQWVVQSFVANSRPVWDMGLHGEGQVLHTSDSGIRTSHNAFRDAAVPITTWGQYPTHRKIIAYIDGSSGNLFGDDAGASYHGTHTAGTVLGDDSPFATDPRDGMALKAKIYFSDIGTNSNSVFPPADLNTLFQPPYTGNAGGAARISSNSWGGLAGNVYDADARACDQFMWNHKDFLICFATGNEAGPGTLRSPSPFKNGLSVGATQNGTSANLMMPLTSEGPTSDGRLKPTILAPGMGIFSANGANDNGYASLTGTSMATPATAGATALIRQYLTEGWYPAGSPSASSSFIPSGSLLKALAINSTDNDMTGLDIPNNTTGWGRIKVDNVLYFSGEPERLLVVDDTDGLATGEFAEYDIQVTDGSVPLKIALCWTDREGSMLSGVQLVNNLDLRVMAPGGIVFYLGNVFAGGESAPAGAADLLNVEECVRLNSPGLGTWTVRVTGTDVPLGPQPFSLAINAGMPVPVGVEDDVVALRASLSQNSPNPFGSATTIHYSLPRAEHVELGIYGLRGEKVRSLISGHQAAGNRAVTWDGRNDAGRTVGSGVYFYRLSAGGFQTMRRMVVMR
jgi:subtilisin family serine protease